MSKEKKKQEEMKEFTVGSVQTPGPKPKAPKTQKVEIHEKDFPVLTSLIKGNEVEAFREEARNVLTQAKQLVDSGDGGKKAEGEQIQKAYALSLSLLDNSKIAR